MTDVLSAILDLDPFVLLMAVGGAALVVCLSLALGGGQDKRRSQRVDKALTRARRTDGPSGAPSLRVSTETGGLDDLMHRLLPRPELLRERLSRTGQQISIGSYGLICLAVALVVMGGLFFANLPLVIVIPGGVILGLWLPHFGVGWAAGRRERKFLDYFPDAIGLMVRGLKSGLPISESFQIVAQEVPGPVGEEFRRITDQMRLGQQLEAAMWDAVKRVGLPEIKFLVVTLSIQRETGGNLAETLENLDNILRRRRQMKLKVRAMSSEARASAAIIGSLPFIMTAVLMVMNGPYIMTLFTTSTGHILLTAGCSSMAIGIGIITKLAKFEI